MSGSALNSSEHLDLVHLRLERPAEGVALLVLDQPELRNAMSDEMTASWVRAVDHLAGDPTVRAVVVSSSHPKAFCVGADLKERNSFSDEELRAQRPLAQAAYRGVLDLPVPVVAAVDGYALGGGFEIALSCDLVVCGEGAVVGLPEVSVGVIPGGGGTQLLTRRVGWSRAARMVATSISSGVLQSSSYRALGYFSSRRVRMMGIRSLALES